MQRQFLIFRMRGQRHFTVSFRKRSDFYLHFCFSRCALWRRRFTTPQIWSAEFPLRIKHLTGREDFILARLGISVSPFSQERRASSQRISRLVYAGSLGLGYSLETVIDALKKDLSLTLDIAGEGEKKDSLIRYAKKCGVQDRVRFHGWLGQEAYFSLLSSCDAGVIPMSDESMVALPNKLFDYLNSSIPVIASLHGECERILLEENLGAVYDEKSPESFIKAVERLRKNPPERISLPPTLRADFIYPEFAREVEEALSRKFGR